MTRYTLDERRAIIDRNNHPNPGTIAYKSMVEHCLKENGRGWWIITSVNIRHHLKKPWIKQFIKD